MIAHPQSQEKKLLYKTLNSNVKTAVKVQKNRSLENKIEQLEIDRVHPRSIVRGGPAARVCQSGGFLDRGVFYNIYIYMISL